MRHLKSPLARYADEPIYTTLVYGDKTFVEVYKRLGWNLQFHNGNDYVNSSNPVKAYCSPVLAAHDGIVQKVEYTTSVSTKGNGITIEGKPFAENGKTKLICSVYWHLADVSVKAGDTVKAGQTIGLLGNSGYSIGGTLSPMAGTHLHFGVYEYEMKDGRWQLSYPNNGVRGAVDNELYMEANWKEKAPIYNPNKIEHLGSIANVIRKSVEALKRIFGLK